MKVGIVGGGIFGLSAALELAGRSHAVTVFERAGPPAPDAASDDHSKALRFEYGAASPLYVPLVAESRSRYQALERGWPMPLYVETGVLALAASLDESRHEWTSYNYLIEHDFPVERWTVDEARTRFPQFSYESIVAVTWNPEGGYVRAAEAVRATAAALREAGGLIVAGSRVGALDETSTHATVSLDAGGRFEFDAVLVAAGAWFRTLVPAHEAQVSPTRQFVTYYHPPEPAASKFEAGRFPVWMHDLALSGWYGMPLENGLVKVARHHPGEPADPDAPRTVTPADRESSRAFVREHLPFLDPDCYAEDRGCLYALTMDGNFLIDRLPDRSRTFVAGGGSGHGFKLGPAVGRLAADLLEGTAAPSAFRFDAVREGRVA